MRTLIFCLCTIVPILLSLSIKNKTEVNTALDELKSIGETKDPDKLAEKALLANEVALYYQFIDETDQARIYFLKAIDFTKERMVFSNNYDAQNLYDVMYLYKNLATFEGACKNVEGAKKAHANALSYIGQLKPLISTADYNEYMSSLYSSSFTWAYHSRQLDEAENFINQAIIYAKKSNSESTRLIKNYRLYGELKKLQNERIEGDEYFDLAIKLSQENKIELKQVLIQSKIGNLYALKKYDQLINFMMDLPDYSSPKQLENVLKETDENEIREYVNNAFVLTFALLKNYSLTEDKIYLEEAYEWQKSLYTISENTVVTSGASKLGVIIPSPTIKMFSTMDNFDQMQKENLLTEEKISSLLRVLDIYNSTSLQLERLNSSLNSENWETLKTLRGSLKNVSKQFADVDQAQIEIRDSLKEEIYNLTQEINSIDKEFKTNDILKEFDFSRDVFSEQLRKYVQANDQTVLTYFYAKPLNKIYAVGMNPGQSFFEKIDVEPRFSDSLQMLFNLNSQLNVEDSILEKQNSLNRHVYSALIEPILKHVDSSKKVVILPLGEINLVNFDALLQPSNEYLVNDFEISYTSSIFAQIQTYRQVYTENKAVTFYPTNFDSDSLPQLTKARHEVQTLQELFESETYESENASAGNFFEKSKNANILHFASHSVLDANHPYESQLVFQKTDSSSNKITAAQIFNSEIDAQLVVLSSCNSAQGNLKDGIGIVSLSNSFVYAGVPCVIGSLWGSQDKSSSDLMTNFYNNIKLEKPVSTSLTEAKRSYIKTADKVTRQPFFWANYSVFGQTNPVWIEPKQSYGWIYGMIASAFLIIGFSYFYKSSKRSVA